MRLVFPPEFLHTRPLDERALYRGILLALLYRLGLEDFPQFYVEETLDQIEQVTAHQFMTRRKASAYLDVSLRTLDRWVQEAGLPSEWRTITPGKKPQRLFLLSDTLEWQLRQLAGLQHGKEDQR